MAVPHLRVLSRMARPGLEPGDSCDMHVEPCPRRPRCQPRNRLWTYGTTQPVPRWYDAEAAGVPLWASANSAIDGCPALVSEERIAGSISSPNEPFDVVEEVLHSVALNPRNRSPG
jgi:hypothetical protein